MWRARLAMLAAASVTVAAAWPSAAGAAPQNGDVAYTSENAAHQLALIHIAHDLGELLDPNPKPLADSNEYDSWGPAYDPTGEWIAFTSNRTGNNEIFTMRADGSQQTQVTTDPGSDQFASWMVGIAGFAYMSQDPDEGDSEISVINADGTNPVRLTNNSQNDLTPAVSPDGRMIAYAQQSQGIRVMNADGSNDHQVPNTSALALAPRWLGNQLVFTEGFGMNNQIFRMNLDGSGKTALTSGSQDVLPVPSPDGEYIMFQRNVGGAFRLFGMLADGQSQGPFEGLDITVQPAGMDQQPRQAPQLVLDRFGFSPGNKTLKTGAIADENAELFVEGVFSQQAEFNTGSRSGASASRTKQFKLKSTGLSVEADAPTKVALKVPKRARNALEQAKSKVKVTLTATATDDLGDSTEVTKKQKAKPRK